MALKALLLGNDLKRKRAALAAMEERAQALAAREAELAAAIDEVETDEQRSQVQDMVMAFEADRNAYTQERQALETAIAELEEQLRAEEAQQNTDPPAFSQEQTPGSATRNAATAETENSARQRSAGRARNAERSEPLMNTLERTHFDARAAVYGQMTRAEQQEMVAREDVQSFLGEIRACMRSRGQKRSITNIGLTIPQVFLDLLRQNILNYSKLTRHVTTQRVNGEGRVLISGDIPEAVWTECCANLNELDMVFYQDAFGCWKLGGYFVVCNANLEDSDIDLAAEVLSTLAQSIGYTDDKTILYGTGVNMPLGIVPRLAQQSQPAGYPATARPWADLHTSNIKTIANTYTGLSLFQQIVLAAGAAKGKYARGEKVWAMNEFTYSFLLAQAMSIDASGAITSAVNGTMPVIGGLLEVLPDSIIPDYNIVMGYYELYRKVDRAGEQYASSDEYFFLSDQTVFKGTVRWDGKPLIAEGFVLMGLNGVTPTTSVTFRGDSANEPAAVILPAAATVAVGAKLQLRATVLPYGVDTALTWTSATTGKATVDANGEVTGVAAGSSVITVTTGNGLTAQCTVTVTA